eukprot:Gregarina_sp_Poly_1__9110@NODE_558_length_7531_cov_98_785102_g439_i0_p4_GENE_NODE_558_length_7531_cov_98_785102_g439_i0NODE_558_length_7531_cov_98_785102_g439_i0_p4_ORF_typecomplete_len284_score42_32SUIM_assoc/PF16619_5/0_028SUIM_assoc/PF16619_5/2_4e03CCDC50_N/PF15295_6/5_2e02CCDC50_N/PF15295_6/2_7CCDC50_N/PF15295_6/2_3_NODE_558_length_7531_cov_98_785102_g439_i06421493
MDGLAEFKAKQRQKYLERQRNQQAAKQQQEQSSLSANTTVPTTAAGLDAPGTACFPPAAPQSRLPVISDEELARRLAEEEDARLAQQIADREAVLAAQSHMDDVRPPDTQFTERLIESPPAVSNVFAQSLFPPEPTVPMLNRPLPDERVQYHAWGATRPPTTGLGARPVHVPTMGRPNPLAPPINPGDAPTIRGDHQPVPFFSSSPVRLSGQPLAATTTSRAMVHPPPVAFIRSPARSYQTGSWASTPSPIASDAEDESRARQLRADEELALRLQHEENMRRG